METGYKQDIAQFADQYLQPRRPAQPYHEAFADS